jgi:hypothetical protein
VIVQRLELEFQECNCVEIADLERSIAVRDSKHPDGPRLILTRRAWSALVADVRDSRHDL